MEGDRTMRIQYRQLTLALLALLGTAAAPLRAAPVFDYTLGLGVEHDDNINLSATDPIGQTVLIPTLGFSIDQKGATLQATAAGTIEYDDYLGGAFADHTRSELAARVDWAALPERLDFSVEDYLGVEPINVLTPNTPSNLQQTNVFAAGPTLRFRFGEPLRGEADLRFIDSRADKTPEFNSTRGLIALRAIRDTSATSSLSANAQLQSVRFEDDGLQPDYRRFDAFLGWQSRGAHLDWNVALGGSRVDFNQGVDRRSEPLLRASLDWRASARSTFTLEADRELSDITQDLMTDPRLIATGAPRVSPGSATINSQLFLEQRVSAAYAFRDTRWTLQIAPFWRKAGYEIDRTQNQTGHGGQVEAGYRLRERLMIGVSAGEETREYDRIARRDEDLVCGLYIAGEWTAHWSWRAEVQRRERHSTAADSRYDENVEMFTVSYHR